MASGLYAKTKKLMLDGGLNMLSHDIKALLVDTAYYTVNLGTHGNLSDVPVGARVATSGNLASKSTTDGVFSAADVTFSAVTGASVEAIIIYRDTGTASTSPLIAYIDTGSGLPVTPNGGDIVVRWDTGANKIFKL